MSNGNPIGVLQAFNSSGIFQTSFGFSDIYGVGNDGRIYVVLDGWGFSGLPSVFIYELRVVLIRSANE